MLEIVQFNQNSSGGLINNLESTKDWKGACNVSLILGFYSPTQLSAQ